MIKFVCNNCGSSNLSYQKYVKCVTPVEIKEDETVVYRSSAIDEDDSLGVECRFCCANCGTTIYHRGDPLETEGDLLHYLSMSEDERKRQNDKYFDLIQSQLDYDEQQRQEFEESMSQQSEN
jgi:hypothetical protein